MFRTERGIKRLTRVLTSRFLLWTLLAGHCCLAGEVIRLVDGTPAEAGIDGARLARVDEVIERAIENGATPGAILLVARQGKVVKRKAYGDRVRKPTAVAMTVDTIFDMASLTKVMATATSIMILVEEGRISLTDRVARHIPEFDRHGKGNLTLLELLTHYSGLRPDVDLDDDWKGYDTGIALACEEKLAAEPGTRFIYSDINFFVLSEVVRRVTGLRIDEFSRQRVFEPLGMRDTSYNPPASWHDRIAPTEPRAGSMLWGSVHDPTTARMDGVAGHAGLFSTVNDTAVFAQMILNRGHYNSTRILSPLAVELMTSNQAPDGLPEWRGLGFDIRSRFSTNRGDLFPVGSFGHTGFTGTSLWIDPSSETFVILFTSRLHPDGKGNVVSLRKKVASVVAAAISDLHPTTGALRH